ncbi:MAG: putative endonuclease [Microgenomates group bacterium Gr01-1014_5]|nr:MAG: putative endonuclease [Microgenomates group bacterium Gr01-1014_5]
MYYTYVLFSLKDKSFYIGYSSNLKKRVKEHAQGKSLATKHKRPYKLIFYEGFINRIDAKNREEYLKSGWGFRSINKMLVKTLGEVR